MQPVGNRAARQSSMNTDTHGIQMTATTPDPGEVKRIAIRFALISLTLLGMLAWSAFLIFMVIRMIQLW
jgi:hypothetical protein